MNKIEQVVRAMCIADNNEQPSKLEWEKYKVSYIISARAGIEAMREPTVFMLDTMDAIDTRELAKDMWQAGIDAALKEE